MTQPTSRHVPDSPFAHLTLRAACSGDAQALSVLLQQLAPDEARPDAKLLALRLSEARTKTLSELSAQWFWETDTQFRFTRFHSGDEALLNQLNSLALGRRRWEMDVEPISTTWAEHQAAMERREVIRDFEYRRTDAAGQVHYWSVNGAPWFDEAGEFVGYIGSGSDISALAIWVRFFSPSLSDP